MTTAGRRGILAVIIAIALLAVGAGMVALLAGTATSDRVAEPAVSDQLAPRAAVAEDRHIIDWRGVRTSLHIADTGSDPVGDSHLQALLAGPTVSAGGTGMIVEPRPIAERDDEMAWLARILLVLSAAWVVIGMLAARTSLVRRPGAAAARATWLASTRPWRARESTLGMLNLDRWLVFIVPAALLVATRAVQTSFFGQTHLVVVVGAWVVFALMLRLMVGRRSPWPVIAAVGGVVVLRCIVTLVGLSFAGPGGAWSALWTNGPLRAVYFTIGFALFVWTFVAAGWALQVQLGSRRAVGAILAAVGAAFALPAALVAMIGLGRVLRVWNDQLGQVPRGLAHVLGGELPFAIADAAAWWAAGAGLVVAIVGVLLARPEKAPPPRV